MLENKPVMEIGCRQATEMLAEGNEPRLVTHMPHLDGSDAADGSAAINGDFALLCGGLPFARELIITRDSLSALGQESSKRMEVRQAERR